MITGKDARALLLALALSLIAASINAEVPQLINYQGRLTDEAGAPLPDDQYSILFTIYDNSEAIIWQETHASVATHDGLFQVLLGAGDHSGYSDLDQSIFSDSARWLGIKVGDDPEIDPRTRLVSVPFAHQSAHAYDADITPPLSLAAADASPIIKGLNSGTGPGIWGESQTVSGATYGGYFHTMSEDGRAVYGFASNMYGSGQNCGGYFLSSGSSGIGVYGYTENQSGGGYGGYFRTSGISGTGVYGIADYFAGTTYGVRGRCESPSGYAGYFEGRVFTDDTLEMTAFKMITDASDGYVLTSDASGNGTWQEPISGTNREMCTGMYEGTTNAASQITINFPVTFTAAPYFSVTGLIASGSHAGEMAYIPKPTLGTSDATVTIQYWNGAIFDNVGNSVDVMLSFTAIEK